MLLYVVGLIIGVVAVAIFVIKGSFDQANARKEFVDDPVQRRLAGHVEAYIYSAQDDDAYARFADAVRKEFDVIGVASTERVRHRLIHAADTNSQQVKLGLKKKPTPAQVKGAVSAIIRVSEEL